MAKIERNYNVYKIYETEESKRYVQINLDDNSCIGVSGKTLKHRPRNLYCRLASSIYDFNEFISGYTDENKPNIKNVLTIFERLASLNKSDIYFIFTPYYYSSNRYIHNNADKICKVTLKYWKEFLKFLEDCDIDISLNQLERFNNSCIMLKERKKSMLSDEQYRRIYEDWFPNNFDRRYYSSDTQSTLTVTAEEFRNSVKFQNLIAKCLENYSIFTYNDILEKVFEYYGFCKELKQPLENGDFVRNYTKMKNSYIAIRNTIINEKLGVWQTRKDFHFENDKYMTVVPTTKEEFVAEGMALNNCLGGYEFNTYIEPQRRNVVFVRDKNNPDKPLIACDFDNTGCIIQYLAKNNIYPLPEEKDLHTFREELQEYLFAIFKNERV